MWIQFLKRQPILPWIIVFVLANLIVTQDGAKNAMSRFATLRAMTEQHTIKIDNYVDWTMDWAKTLDGHYYSNKAPGPMLLAFPVFWLLDQVTKLGEGAYRDERGRRKAPGYAHKTIMSFLMQVFPFALLTIFSIILLKEMQLSFWAEQFVALALLFGNTVAIFMNSYFGHAFTACLLMAALLSFIRKNYYFVGFCSAAALLSEYSAAFFVFIFLFYLMKNNRSDFRWLKSYVLGISLPAILWISYHYSAFGSIFSIANQFQNPEFLDMATKEDNLWGIFSLTPQWKIFYALLFGNIRGILFTQPWLLLSFPFVGLLLWQGKLSLVQRQISIISFTGFALLLWMNASFGGWHGGASAGPRYLSIVFPFFAIVLGFCYDKLNIWQQYALWITLAVAIIFRGQIYATTILAPNLPIWQWQWHELTNAKSGTPYLRLFLYYLMLSSAAFFIWKKHRKNGLGPSFEDEPQE